MCLHDSGALALHVHVHAALQDMVQYKRKLFAIKGQILYGFKQGHGQGFAISRNSLICEFVISGVDCTVYVFIAWCLL